MSNYEPLPGIPGLLDDSQLPLYDLPNLPDFQIAPLRNPAPSRHGIAPSPLEPETKTLHDRRPSGRVKARNNTKPESLQPSIKPSDILLAREAKKPHLAISELVEDRQNENPTLQLPSFVSLSVVERSPIPQPSYLNRSKRPRLEQDVEPAHVEMNRLLPRPAKKDEHKARPVPLLPAMVTGLHEPPPSAGLLPSISDSQPAVEIPTVTSKMKVKDMLAESKHSSSKGAPETVTKLANTSRTTVGKQQNESENRNACTEADREESGVFPSLPPKQDVKSRRVRRIWTRRETIDLQAGIEKHGVGKWKLILEDPEYNFVERTAVDLKDRYRVFSKQGAGATPATSGERDGETTKRFEEEKVHAKPTPTIESLSSLGRRKRQLWTGAEDAALLAGVAKHGFQWSVIHADSDHDWGARRPTDLRDRIRTLFPEGYKNAEYRPLAKERVRPDTEGPHNQEAGGKERKSREGCMDSTMQEKVKGHPAQVSGKDVLFAIDRAPNRTLKDGQPQQILENTGVTLPSLAFNDDDMEWDNRLPPLLDWEEAIGD